MQKRIYGKELILDLVDCNPEIIRSKKKILEYLDKLCQIIKMKKYGSPIVKRFGFGQDYTAGYSAIQLIETSAVTSHFSEAWNSVYINIFSCKSFDERKAKDFTQEFFRAKKVKNRVILR